MCIFSCFKYVFLFLKKYPQKIKVPNVWQHEQFSQHLTEKNKDSQGFEELTGRNKPIKCDSNMLKSRSQKR